MKRIFSVFCLLAATYIGQAQSMTPKDAEFAMDAAQISLLEIKLAELAITSADTSIIKRLAQTMINDHTRSYNELKALVLTKNLTVPSFLDTESLNKVGELRKKSGKEFDKAYAGMVVKAHQSTIAKFKSESKTGSDNELRSWSSVTLPVLEHHLIMSQDADAVLNKK